MEYKVKDLSLAKRGRLEIEWAEMRMPVLMKIRKRFEKEKPLKGITIAACLHVTKETAVLVRTLVAGGAEVALAPSNPLSTQDSVAAALAEEGIHVFAWRGMTTEEYYEAIGHALSYDPDITMDDGADMITTLHEMHRGVKNKNVEVALKTAGHIPDIHKVRGGTEETTTGVTRIKAMERDGILMYPVIAVNNAYTKYLFDNRYGTGQSTIDGILRSTNVLLAGKVAVVAGYGWCGRGIALRLKGMGARVIITEVNPLRALEAVMDGFEVMPMKEAAKIGDIFITATGNIKVIRKEHFELMKDGAILANAGHFNVEVWIPDLESLSVSKREIRPNVTEYRLKSGKRLYLLAEGRLVNLAAAEGHPSEVMDLSFSNQALSVEYLVKNRGKLEPKVYNVPKEIDEEVARLKLESMGVKIDTLTEEQKEYLESWTLGT
ncbi:MAG: adenosylhomocysteinase [Thermoprotei archaeon]|nr:MAG: adenosylhomocysteinase [Thermoprotei archaeon]RLF18344.1 MAG: adenosylhomocysteinase [Thermoprotei archaeon]